MATTSGSWDQPRTKVGKRVRFRSSTLLILALSGLAAGLLIFDRYAIPRIRCTAEAMDLLCALRRDIARGRVQTLEIVFTPDTVIRRIPRQTRDQLRQWALENDFRLRIEVGSVVANKIDSVLRELRACKTSDVGEHDEFVEYGAVFLDAHGRELHSIFGAWGYGRWDVGFFDGEAVLLSSGLRNWVKALTLPVRTWPARDECVLTPTVSHDGRYTPGVPPSAHAIKLKSLSIDLVTHHPAGGLPIVGPTARGIR